MHAFSHETRLEGLASEPHQTSLSTRRSAGIAREFSWGADWFDPIERLEVRERTFESTTDVLLTRK